MRETDTSVVDSVVVNSRYKLTLLKRVRCDDVRSALQGQCGIYVCSYPDAKWHEMQGLPVLRNYAIKKKTRFFALLSRRSWLVSPTQCVNPGCAHPSEVRYRKVLLGSRWRSKRLQQCSYLLQLFWLFFRLRRSFDYVLFYNFEMPIFLSAVFAKVILRKRVWIDFEDDYALTSRASWKNILTTRLLYNIPDAVICAAEPMVHRFPEKQTFVFNGFIEIASTATVFHPKVGGETVFMYAGRLDDIRGADLLPEVAAALREAFGKVRVLVTGEGPLESDLRSQPIAGVEFLGFLPESEFARTLAGVDAFLVLQKPDHPFNRGSFPSKIEYYAAMKRPIFALALA